MMIEPTEYLVMQVGIPESKWFCSTKFDAECKMKNLANGSPGKTFVIYKRVQAAVATYLEIKNYEE